MTRCLHRLLSVLFLFVCLLTLRVEAQCFQLTLSESRVHAHLRGDYRYFCQTDDGRPIYKHVLKGAYIYHVLNGSSYWTVGPVVDGAYAYLKARDGAASPDQVQAAWQAWRGDQRRWTSDGVKLICTECRDLRLGGVGTPTAIRGRYVSRGQVHNLRPSYRHTSRELYLHYTGCGKWVVGPRVGRNVGAMYTESNASLPWEAAEPWTVFLPTTQLQTRDVSVACSDGEAGAFRPISDLGCGRQQVGTNGPVQYLLQGTEVKPHGKYPWVVSVRRPDGVHRCGGVLVGSRWVLTAGHCTPGTGPSSDTAVLGAHNLDLAREPQRQAIHVQRSHRHPNFSWSDVPFEVHKDLALLELEQDVTYGDYVQPVCLPHSPTSDLPQSAEQCFIAGWGKISYDTEAGGVLRELTGRLVDVKTCANNLLSMLRHWLKDTSSICVMPKNYGKICLGDSGGPLLCSRGGRWYVLGVASWVIVACLPTNLPSVFMDVRTDLPWLQSIMDG